MYNYPAAVPRFGRRCSPPHPIHPLTPANIWSRIAPLSKSCSNRPYFSTTLTLHAPQAIVITRTWLLNCDADLFNHFPIRLLSRDTATIAIFARRCCFFAMEPRNQSGIRVVWGLAERLVTAGHGGRRRLTMHRVTSYIVWRHASCDVTHRATSYIAWCRIMHRVTSRQRLNDCSMKHYIVLIWRFLATPTSP